jgi:hypothetical protein
MKIKYEKKGLIAISIVFILSSIINAIVEEKYSFLIIAYTVGAFFPYFIFLFIYLIYSLIKHKEIRFFTDWRVSIFLILLELVLLREKYNEISYKKSTEDIPKINSTEVKKSELLKSSFKQFLKENKIDMDLEVPNQYETLQPGNKYSNYYFNLTTDFPDNWEHDRGVSDYAIFRTYQPDSAFSMSLIAIPIKSDNPISEESHLEFQREPLKTLNKDFGNDYEGYLLKQLNNVSIEKVYDLKLKDVKIRSVNFLSYSYKRNETYDGVEVPFITIAYQTILWGVTYTFNYSAPFEFHNPNIFESVLSGTNFVNPTF